jgi:hypothetical protein
MTDLDLDALEALLKEAPHPGEWKATSGGTLRTDDASIDYPPCVRSHWKDEQERRCQRIIAESDNEADVSLIAALYNAAPELIAEAREARRLREVERNIRFYANSIEDTLRNRPSLPPASPWGDGYNEACNHVIRELRDIVGVKPVVSTEENEK